ncbi:bifunctional phosphatase PAP2/diacylglycerol kinase family protein [Microlunatus ginsengisoli]|uniref:diacylglycerol kinase family protein n=1 Tax=Microlunatus ginsengisoli TaxID=363863 RepID=UPI0031DBBD57
MIAVALLVGFVGWTLLVAYWPPIQALDQRLVAKPLTHGSVVAQIASAFALLTWPGLEYLTLLAISIWAFRRRLRQLAVSLVLIVLLAWGGGFLLRLAFARPRPENALDLITSLGYAYPSGHLVSAVAFCIGIGATLNVTRQTVRARSIWLASSFAIVTAVAVDRWILGAHWVSDIVGGILYGSLAACTALLIAGIAVPVPHELVTELLTTPEPTRKRCAVIYNPAKVTDWVTFRRHVDYELSSRGWERALWLETTIDDPGRAMADRAVSERVDLVLGAGGDGTVRVICDRLAGSGIPFGLIPAGTGNLLAKNIGIPLDEAAALDVAFDGVDKPIDLVRISVDDGPPEHFAVMAGIGIDAVIMEGTNPDLKRAVGPAAYFVSAAKHANHPALHATIRVDREPPLRRRAHVLVIGNVGVVTGNIALMPQARPDDATLDVLVASPRGPRDWARLITKVVARQNREDDQLDRLTGARVRISVDPPDSYQLDGDTIGVCSSMTAEVAPGALVLRVPRAIRRAIEQGASTLELAEIAEQEAATESR